ncbi:hypothetical protein HanXRQr2_Chr01g0036911 [Helianthus annuus]|uniref:Uncharacterized protein n=1 Tax=Helianthus annuus TaxID=4232 RepID=A0A9K3JXF4_HELAN|nr:hypothetical protein HanXRQr2_Chr01g0036911 [Helianthus annuus]KAJ0628034.1 hypothetical protein HanHA89_Chr01g0032351 [Helianthus annuus]
MISRSGSRVCLLSLSRSKLFRSAFPSRLKRWTKIEAARARVVTRLRLTPARIPKSGEAPASSPVTDETWSISKAAFGLLVSGPSGQMTWIRGGPTSLDIRNIKEAIDEWKRWW